MLKKQGKVYLPVVSNSALQSNESHACASVTSIDANSSTATRIYGKVIGETRKLAMHKAPRTAIPCS
jgi:hypothetical protein